jgi:3-phenylpropionate/trans-cinnamate dioxygenase ferredoxin reductase component
VVDEFLVTSDPAISAIGDCAFYPSRHLPGMARLESVQNATDQGRAVAARIMGETKPYDALPWFWSIQGEARLQIAGLSKQGLNEIVRGDPTSGKFSVFLYEGERLASVESVNAPGEHMAARRLIAANPDAQPLYVTEPGAVVGIDGGRLTVSKRKEELASARLIDVLLATLWRTLHGQAA